MNDRRFRPHAPALTILAIASLAASGFVPPQSRAVVGATLVADDPRCEYLIDPLGIDARAPRLAWKLKPVRPEARGLMQSAYQVLVAPSESALAEDKGTLWDSGKVASDRSIHVPYEGKPLGSYTVCRWKVRVWDQNGNVSAWSKPARWTMGLLESKDWTARWIGLDEGEETDDPSSILKTASWIWTPGGNSAVGAPIGTRYFRRTADLPAGRRVRKARLLATADDSFVAFINGRPVASGQGWNVLKDVDVTSLLKPGVNAVAIAATNAKSTTVAPDKNPAGLIAVLKVEFEEGPPLVISTDAAWRTSEKDIAGWDRDGFNDAGWKPARVSARYGTGPWGKFGGSNHRRLASRMLRREFKLTKAIRRADASVCGLGFFDLYINGRLVGDQLMNPALTGYDRRDCYVTFDLTRDLVHGPNAVGVVLSNGRYFAPRRDIPVPMRTYGFPKLLFQLRIEYADGSIETIVSDENWRLTTDGPLRASNEFDGEEYDARQEMPGWSRPSFDDSSWRRARLVDPPGGTLEAQMIEPIRIAEILTPVRVTNPKPGIYLVDFGQSFYGSVRLRVSGPAGSHVRMHTSFNVKPDGLLNADNDRSAINTDIYTLKGQGAEVWHPRFKGNATRYVQVEGFPGTPTAENFDGLVIHTDMGPSADSSARTRCSTGST